MKFNDYEWHDAILKDLNIDRSNPGYNDIISMDIEWPDDTISTVIFNGVYKAIMDMNFGFIAQESIYMAYSTTKDDIEYLNLAEKWSHYLDVGKLNCYIIEFSTSGSKIKIIAKSFKVLKPDK